MRTAMLETYELWPPSTPPDIRGKDHNAAIDLMVRWFFANFEDPAESTPRDDGDWVWIWGGPYYARDEIEYAFGDVASEQLIDEATTKIEADGFECAPNADRIRAEQRE
jgi:hypothetical protein